MTKPPNLDFDVGEFCKNLRNSKAPPYVCPVANCLKGYRTIYGLQYHLTKHDHSNPTPVVTPSKSHRKKGRGGHKSPSKTQELLQPVVREALTYAEAQKMVEFEVDSRVIRVGITDDIPIISKEDFEERYGMSDAKEGKPIPRLDPMKPDELKIKLPEPSFKIIENYNISDAPPRPTNAYIRFIEKSSDELDGEVEYDLDEEDCAWLAIMNEKRAEAGVPAVPVDTFELLMDRLEKESYFQMANTKNPECTQSDDDAVCCICMDGECQNTNVILFCDMCNLAVHQDCYGVPYIPEGQWLCRRCLQSPSKAVDCQLCPNTGGAFKQTDRGYWAHVVCALWIPEVRFANTVFLEPIDSIDTIPPARWRLTCYICKQRGLGACIQCHKTNCYSAFHVTCAQQAGLVMRMDTVKDSITAGTDPATVMVQKTAFCDAHTPADAEVRPRIPPSPQKVPKASKTEGKMNMKQARRILAKNRTAVPVISIPTIPPDRVQEISALVTIPKKSQFIQRLIPYWTLKRQWRNGVPLLRRLQTSHLSRRDDGKFGTEQLSEYFRQIKYLQNLRQDLEKARLLCELVRKREKKKNELTKAKEACLLVQLCPLQYFLTRIWEQITARDTNGIFSEPVDVTQVPDYSEVVTEPMDLSTMKGKIDGMTYGSIAEFEEDFHLMIRNCLAYNSKDTIFYRAGQRMRDQGLVIIKAAQNQAREAGIEGAAPKKSKAVVETKEPEPEKEEIVDEGEEEDTETEPKEIDRELKELQSSAHAMTLDEQMKKLIDLADMAQNVRNALTRKSKCRLIKTEMTKLKKKIAKATKLVLEEKSVKKEAVESPKKLPPPAPAAAPERKKEESAKESDGESSSSDKPLKSVVKAEPPKSRKKRRRSGAPASTAVGGDSKKLAVEEEAGPSTEKSNVSEVTPTKTATGSESATASPTGVNRRTTILFRKAQGSAVKKPPTNSDTQSSSTSSTATATTATGSGTKRRAGRPRRNLDSTLNEGSNPDPDPAVPCSDSFRVYRSGGEIPVESDDDTQSEETSRSTSGSGSSSSYSSSGPDDGASSSDEENGTTSGTGLEPALEPLDLVWAKCRGYPWYPALIIDPKMPRDYVHNGVPIPAPPADVLALANSYTEPVYLVLFFDTKRTWQWLPRTKLEILGLTKELDEAKLTESRKPTDRKAVRKAYQDALCHRGQVTKPAEVAT